jgi:hypothetical protein
MLVDKVSKASGKYVCSLDVGTTTIRAFIYDQNGKIKGRDLDKVRLQFFLHTSTKNSQVQEIGDHRVREGKTLAGQNSMFFDLKLFFSRKICIFFGVF